ncbi:molybdopterin-dependent oxidoreductase [Methanoplanus endosymbiosus]|uniref:Molybdopterin-dependent oxidoreductase n=1 Tax=Methanoplanus endosymbiosus TaxID=33865 RepID=A0A9E7PPV8_9EURY|nr:molybdopterin-dependent oxidoreductase [Methanoplanus endosymbiosus]UUX93835.1 molybdopterin-dependent oxidoreductase [Methanoplanus endosymbiosus]
MIYIRNILRGFLPVFLVVLLLAFSAGCTGSAESAPGDNGNQKVAAEEPSGNITLVYKDGTEKILNYDDLSSLPQQTGWGYSVSTVGIKYGPYRCTGPLLSDIAGLSGGMKEDDLMWVSADDGYMWVFDYEQVNGDGYITLDENLRERESPELKVILMHTIDGHPLEYNDGAPYRVAIISDSDEVITEGSCWVKWVSEIEIKGGPDEES